MLRRVLVRSDRCIGCRSCEMACMHHHLEESDDDHAFRPLAVPRVKVECGVLDRDSGHGRTFDDMISGGTCARPSSSCASIAMNRNASGPASPGRSPRTLTVRSAITPSSASDV